MTEQTNTHQSAFMSGKLKISGHMTLAMRLQQLFPTNH